MILGQGQWPRVTWRTGRNQCALLLEKSVLGPLKGGSMLSVKVKYFTFWGVDFKISVECRLGIIPIFQSISYQNKSVEVFCIFRLLEGGCRVSGWIFSVSVGHFFCLNVGCRMKNFGNVGCRNNPFHGPSYCFWKLHSRWQGSSISILLVMATYRVVSSYTLISMTKGFSKKKWSIFHSKLNPWDKV